MSSTPLALAKSTTLIERVADFVELTKPRIGLMVLLAVAAGGYLGADGQPIGLAILHAVIGTAFVASGASVLNQVFEKQTDARMDRTSNRPLPAGRVGVRDALILGLGMAVVGLLYLSLLTNRLTAGIALLSLVLYVWVYTPLKRTTSINTIVGAIPGALPPVIGWAAVANPLDPRAGILFLILFFWQFPHFMAIAWLYRDDYSRAGLKMLPTSEIGRTLTGIQAVSYALVLLPISLMPSHWNMGGTVYFWSAMVLGAHYLCYSVKFLTDRTDLNARRLLFSSLIYLPMVLGVLMLDHSR